MRTSPKINETEGTPALREFLKTHPNPSIVLRVPKEAGDVTEGKGKHGPIWDRIEKKFVKAGFAVRDRALVEQVLRSGTNSYAEVHNVTQADLLLEILEFELSDNRTSNVENKNGKAMTLLNASVEPRSVTLGYKIIIVNSGQTAGFFTLNKTSCSDGCEFWVKTKKKQSLISYDRKRWSSGLTWGWWNDEMLGTIIDDFADIIISTLK